MRILGLPPDVGTPGEPIMPGQKEPIGPCGLYRIKYPFDALSQLDFVQTDYGAYPLDYVWEYVRDFDIVVLHRQTMPSMRSFVEHCQLFLGKKVVVDVDDAVLRLDPRNPAYVWWGANKKRVWDVFCRLRDRERADPRLHNVGPDQIWAVVQENRHGFKWMLRTANLVTVTTKFLRGEYESYNKNIIVLPNCIKATDWENLEPKRLPETEGKIVLGWAGGDSHGPDLKSVSNAIARVLREFDNVVFVIVGYVEAKKLFAEDVQEKIYTVPWSGISEYRGWLAGFDVGLAPSQKIITNQAKSGIRIYELALAKSENPIAVVASPTPYVNDIHTGMGTVAPNDAKFYKAIIQYIENEELRHEHGWKLRLHVLAEHTIEKNAWRWHAAYQELI